MRIGVKNGRSNIPASLALTHGRMNPERTLIPGEDI